MSYENDLANTGLISGGLQGFITGMRDAADNKQKKYEFDAKMKMAEQEAQRAVDHQAIEMRKSGLQKNAQGAIEENQDYMDRQEIEKLASSHQRPVYNDKHKLVGSELDPVYAAHEIEKAKAQALIDPYGAKKAGAENSRLEAEKKRREAEQAAKGKPLPSEKVLHVQEGAQAPKTLENLRATIESNEDLFGPAAGRIGQNNPWNTQSQTVDAQMRAASQMVGRYMENGVLRKEDEVKYRKMLPVLPDAPQVAKNKLKLVEKMMVDKHNGDIMALKKQGYDISGFDFLPEVELPEGLVGGQSSLIKPQTLLGAGVQAGAAPKGKITVTNGKETLQIEAGDLADAIKDGFKKVP